MAHRWIEQRQFPLQIEHSNSYPNKFTGEKKKSASEMKNHTNKTIKLNNFQAFVLLQ